ncbi:hypothetical protein P4646_05225 [Peribacillus simplex]|uniref:hypothetical protein n=1 Tax=Peribacillus simplex TaxID=1478 RepID=UPI002E23DC2F|nr:hypothetical protein [Peribacillus simplex]MED4097003.1 hypothetical protein [Peribacillus simplex]
MKFTYLIGTLTVTSALLLAGCSTNEATVKKEATTAQASNVEKEKKVEITKEEKIAELPSPYDEIGKRWAEWELPKEGRLPKTDKAYQGFLMDDDSDPRESAVIYENGYGFDKKTGYYVTAAYERDEEFEGRPPEVTPDQREGMIMGIIAEYFGNEYSFEGDFEVEPDEMYVEDKNGKKIPNQTFIANLYVDIESHKVDALFEIRHYAELDKNKPLEDWANETINFFLDAKETDDIEVIWKLYSEGEDNIAELSKTVKLARE